MGGRSSSRKDTGWLGTVVCVTDSQKIATIKGGRRRPQRLPLFAKIANPYYATIADNNACNLFLFARLRKKVRLDDPIALA